MDHSLLFSLLGFVFLASIYTSGAAADDVLFSQNYKDLWGNVGHVLHLNQDKEIQLIFDQSSGAGFISKEKYGSGMFNMKIKLPQKDTSGIITTFYLKTERDDNRDEIDFEFLGSSSNIKLHTNIFINGQGGREQEIDLWFNPTIDFHDYTLLWNQYQIVFIVDNIPIRVFKNKTSSGGSFPTQPMNIIGTIWNAPAWIGQVNWADAPFQAHYKGFGISGCQTQTTNDPQCQSSNLWWNEEKYWKLDSAQQKEYENVRSKYLVYDYCSKIASSSPECQN
ncbi:Xyloglucan endotransglucosylase/hydrolase [Quillaja saponaria]|uniref:Xyloglucan endotransglucosylase/hydrolase n=1 Tax=Quillaja saponaria TaxID=32244 RepID=A0AAD7Q1T7_QUISA|nr:Xyloglucan endotransglucosylase/hydrolase [Quillaja saponaria]